MASRLLVEMRLVPIGIAALAICAFAPASHGYILKHAVGTLRSPWDRQTPRPRMQPNYDCPALSPPPRVISFTGYYTDSRHSIVDPAAKARYEAASAPIENYTRAIVKAADAFRQNGSAQAAACALKLLQIEADAGSLTDPHASADESRQAFYVQTWMTAGSAIAYLKVESAASPSQEAEIGRWLRQLGNDVVHFQERLAATHSEDSRNNIHAWASLAAAAAGLGSHSPDLFGWGVQAGRQELGEVDADGYLPLELQRGRRALHYHIFTVAPLVTLAELARSNGIDLYAQSDGALRRLAQRVLLGIEDPVSFEQRAGEVQEPADLKSGVTASWVAPLERRFPDIHLSSSVRSAAKQGYFMLGGFPPP